LALLFVVEKRGLSADSPYFVTGDFDYENRSPRRERQFGRATEALQQPPKRCLVAFLDEEEFERIIDYYDDKEELAKPLKQQKQHWITSRFSSLLIKKADLLLATRKYHRPWKHWRRLSCLMEKTSTCTF
jgi:hypothetical protein